MALEGVGKPLRLKDLLELECDSCSAAGFRCYPRRLCVAGAAAASASSPMHHLSRSLSRRLKVGFWRRRREEEAAAAAAGPPVAAVSSCGCSSDSETSESSNSTERKSQSDFSSASSESLRAGVPAAAGDEYEATKRESREAGSSMETDDKEQLSPVAVMDFPFNDNDGGGEDDEDVVEVEERNAGTACSPSFSDSLAQLQRRKMQLQHKIRRLGSIGELGPVDLEARFAASDSDGLGDVPVQTQLHATATPGRNGHLSVNIHQEAGEDSLLELLTDTVSVGVDDASERLLLDFFVETKRRYECVEFHALTGRWTQKLNLSRNGEVVRLAKAWLEGTGSRWDLKDVLYRREDFVAEMERSRRWMRVGEEASEIGLVVAGLVIDELVDELVRDLIL